MTIFLMILLILAVAAIVYCIYRLNKCSKKLNREYYDRIETYELYAEEKRRRIYLKSQLDDLENEYAIVLSERNEIYEAYLRATTRCRGANGQFCKSN